MEQHDKNEIIPEQRIGSKLDTAQEFQASSEDEARQLFDLAATRLLNVNEWDKICGPMSAKFILTDESGKENVKSAKPGHHFKIDVPGPGPKAGDGYDWVRVEALEDNRDPGGARESVTMRVRPAPSPQNVQHDTAHFFKDSATSSFRVERIGNIVRAEVHGRNEVPNTDVEKVVDKVRNAMVGVGATAGFSTPQWKSLVNGLLKRD